MLVEGSLFNKKRVVFTSSTCVENLIISLQYWECLVTNKPILCTSSSSSDSFTTWRITETRSLPVLLVLCITIAVSFKLECTGYCSYADCSSHTPSNHLNKCLDNVLQLDQHVSSLEQVEHMTCWRDRYPFGASCGSLKNSEREKADTPFSLSHHRSTHHTLPYHS